MTKHLSYNERAWAIDLISEANKLLSGTHRVIQRVGGEMGVTSQEGGRTLYPDVLLFSDQSQFAVIHGWELKMPDTDITSDELLMNAYEKCRRLGLHTFSYGMLRRRCCGLSRLIPTRKSSHGIVRVFTDATTCP